MHHNDLTLLIENDLKIYTYNYNDDLIAEKDARIDFPNNVLALVTFTPQASIITTLWYNI